MAESVDDEFLVRQFKQGDQAEGLERNKPPFGRAAFERIVEKYSADIALLANRLLGWPGEVEDVMQDVFLAAFVGLKKFRGECSLKTWLFTITINKCRSYRYKQILWQRKTIPKLRLRLPHTADKPPMDSETFDRVRCALTALPVKYREPLVLRYLQELSINEISRILGISENALNVRLSRARKCLRDDLAELMER